MDDPRFPVVRVNLVEHSDWKWKDSDRIMEAASDAAFDSIYHLGISDLEVLVHDLAVAKGKRGGAPKRRFSSDEILWMAEEIKKGSQALEETRSAILDASTYMYEEAMLPMRSDVRYALELAGEKTVEDYPLNQELWESVFTLRQARLGPKEWAPRKRLTEEDIVKDLLRHVTLEWEEGHWDRYLVFDFRQALVTHELLSRSTWEHGELVGQLQEEFRELRETYLTWFFSWLESLMRDIDVSNRTDWKKHWREMLKSGIAPHVQKEMAKAVEEMPEVDDA